MRQIWKEGEKERERERSKRVRGKIISLAFVVSMAVHGVHAWYRAWPDLLPVRKHRKSFHLELFLITNNKCLFIHIFLNVYYIIYFFIFLTNKQIIGDKKRLGCKQIQLNFLSISLVYLTVMQSCELRHFYSSEFFIIFVFGYKRVHQLLDAESSA